MSSNSDPILRTLAHAWLAFAFLSIGAQAETATVDGHDIYYETHGDLASNETPVLLLHGGMNSIDLSFSDLIPKLASKRPVIAIEQQGHGHTADRNGPVTLDSMRRDTLGVLDHLRIGEVHVVGFSMGGMLGLDLAINAPDRVASLSAISAASNLQGMIPEITQMNRDPAFKPSPEVAQLLPTEADFKEMRTAFAENPSGPEHFQVMMEKLEKWVTSDWDLGDDKLSSIKVPVLLAIGDRDFILPGHALAMADTIPDARLAMLPETTHMNIMKRTELLLPMIESLIVFAEKN